MDLEVSNLDQSEGGNMRGGHWQKKTDERGGGRKEEFLILRGVSVTPPSQMQTEAGRGEAQEGLLN